MTQPIIPWDDNCPVYKLFDLLGKKWTIYLILLLGQNIDTFGRLAKRLPKINSKILAERLDMLIENKIVERNVTSSKPLKINYSLSKKGWELFEKIQPMEQWALASDDTQEFQVSKVFDR